MSTNTKYDIKVLLLRVAEGDEIAFRAVFDHFKAPFHAAAFKMTRSADMAEEIVQETFILLWSKRKRVAASSNPEAYLFKILYNGIYAHFRKVVLEKKLRLNIAGQADETAENSVEELLYAKENRQILEALISQMPAQQQLVYRLSKQEALSREEIATRLKISPHTVKNHLAGAREFIRAYLKKGIPIVIWAAIWNSL